MHNDTVKRILKVADRAPEAKVREWLKLIAASYIHRLETPTYTLTKRQLARAMSEPDCSS